jgi:hypothetical protein
MAPQPDENAGTEPLSPHAEPAADIDPALREFYKQAAEATAAGDSFEDEPGGYVRIERRADLTWGVSIRGDNERSVWTNGEGWELAHAVRQSRRYFPTLVIQVVTAPDDDVRPTTITPDQPVP